MSDKYKLRKPFRNTEKYIWKKILTLQIVWKFYQITTTIWYKDKKCLPHILLFLADIGESVTWSTTNTSPTNEWMLINGFRNQIKLRRFSTKKQLNIQNSYIQYLKRTQTKVYPLYIPPMMYPIFTGTMQSLLLLLWYKLWGNHCIFYGYRSNDTYKDHCCD